jgi:hypothetical protein
MAPPETDGHRLPAGEAHQVPKRNPRLDFLAGSSPQVRLPVEDVERERRSSQR